MSLTFAGVSLPVWSQKASDFFNSSLDLGNWFPHNLNDETYRQLDYLPLPPFPPDDGSPEVGVLKWPRYASRWASFFVPVTKTALDAIRLEIGDENDPKPLILANGDSVTERVVAEMYFTAAKPLSAVQTTEYGGDLWLLCLADQRWYWWQKGFSTGDTPPSSWADMLSQIESALDVVFTGDTAIESAYGVPTNRWADIQNAPACLILDAVMDTLQRRVVVHYDGTVEIQRPETAQADQNAAHTLFRSKIMAGGISDPADVARTLPSTFRTLFGVQTGAVPTAEQYGYSVSLNQLYNAGMLTGFVATPQGYPGATGFAVADGYATWPIGAPCGDPANLSQITAQSFRFAADWYSWRPLRLEAGYGTLSAWPLNALTEQADHHYRQGDAKLVVDAEPQFNNNVYGSYDINDPGDEIQPCTTTTTAGPPCSGTATWTYDTTTGVWTLGSNDCSANCVPKWPTFCPIAVSGCPSPQTTTDCVPESSGDNNPPLCSTTLAPTTVGPGTTTTTTGPCWIYPPTCSTTTCAPIELCQSPRRCRWYANPTYPPFAWEQIYDDQTCGRITSTSPSDPCCSCNPPGPNPRDCSYAETPCIPATPPAPPCPCCGTCTWIWVPEHEGPDGSTVPGQWVEDEPKNTCSAGRKPCDNPITGQPQFWSCECPKPSEDGGYCSETRTPACYIPGGDGPIPCSTTAAPTTTPAPLGWCAGSCQFHGDGVGGWVLDNADCVGECCVCLEPSRDSEAECDTIVTGCGPNCTTTTAGPTTTLRPFDCPDYEGDLCVKLTGSGCNSSFNVINTSSGVWRHNLPPFGSCTSLRVQITCSGGVWQITVLSLPSGTYAVANLSGVYPNLTGTITGLPCCGGLPISVSVGLPGTFCTTTAGPTTTAAPCSCDDANICLKITGTCSVNLSQIAYQLVRQSECRWSKSIPAQPVTCPLGTCTSGQSGGATLSRQGTGCPWILYVRAGGIWQTITMTGTYPDLSGTVDLSGCGCGTGTVVTSIDATCTATGCTTTAAPATTTTTTTTTTAAPASNCGGTSCDTSPAYLIVENQTYTCYPPIQGSNRTYRFVAPTTGNYRICLTTGNTVFYGWKNSACSDITFVSSAFQSCDTTALTAGQTYYVATFNSSGGGPISFRVEAGSCPC